ncbi:ABC transporter ATP-binding protein [Devosia albogilva]|uniref:ABC transporter ATP-binding protein n=1 Tax=Devosia albogilva TaxID=429726 RepID=A0ABW5QL66_9HYPH
MLQKNKGCHMGEPSADGFAVKLKLEGVEKKYGDFQALRPTHLEVKEGEFVTLLGPSGSGKTTLLSLIAGTNYPSGGSISIDGRPATELPAHKRDVGVIFQNYALFPHLTVAENIAFPLRMRGERQEEVQRKCDNVLSAVGLTSFGNRFPSELSGGQQQRVAFARCVVYEPSVILMDEPLGALDKRLRDSMQDEIRRLHKALGTTVVYITHDQTEALTLSDRICLMKDGEIVQSGAPSDLYFRPNSRFAAEFFGEANLYPYEAEGSGASNVAHVKDLGAVSPQAPEQGTSGWMMIRPQCLQLDPETPHDELRTCRVSDIRQVGFYTQFHLTLDQGGASIILQRLSDVSSLSRWHIGQSVTVGWNWRDVAFFSEERERHA